MVNRTILRKVASYLPRDLREVAKKLYYRDRHWAHKSLKRFGTVQDLYYWVADDNLDTLLMLQNYFSALFPNLNTDTDGAVVVYDAQGERLGSTSFTLGSHGCAKFRVSSLLEDLQVSSHGAYGTLDVQIHIPEDVLLQVQDQKSFYFWDRFYIGYVNARGQTCFVHGVDKTHIYREGQSNPIYWYGQGENHEWAPEIPVDIEDYARFNVILINRSAKANTLTLTLSDVADQALSWEATIAPRGVHRFELNRDNTAGLVPTELRMRIRGMTTDYGRPVVFKEFSNGAISAMHC